MSYVAEPYAQFVDDLLTALTGGTIRQRFVFLPEEEPYRLSSPGAIIPDTVRISGQWNESYSRFRRSADFELVDGDVIEWKQGGGAASGGPHWPDEGTAFYVNFDYVAVKGDPPRLTDRNPGSIVRLLAESFARELAVISRQLEAVYRAGFLDTATGRDLEQLVRLVGITRRGRDYGSGTVVFSRRSPAAADMFIPSGTRLSTADPPVAVFETVEEATLRRGDLSVEVPIQALEPGETGVVAADSVQVIHRPILGIEAVSNPLPTRIGGGTENDETMRVRARRALEHAGGATTGALLGALGTLPGLREKDIRIGEDHVAHPGVVKLDVSYAFENEETCRRAVELIEEARPVGVRIQHNIDAAAVPTGNEPGPGGTADAESPAPVVADPESTDARFFAVNVEVVLVPDNLALTTGERKSLNDQCLATIREFLDDAGAGETLVHNRLVSRLMAIDGVLDVWLKMYPVDQTEPPYVRNIVPATPTLRPSEGQVSILIGGVPVLLDVTVNLELEGADAMGKQTVGLQDALKDVEDRLTQYLDSIGKGQLPSPPTAITPASLLERVADHTYYSVTELHYRAEYSEAGVRINKLDLELPITGLERFWIRNVGAQ